MHEERGGVMMVKLKGATDMENLIHVEKIIRHNVVILHMHSLQRRAVSSLR